jgi:hypothetical protein
MAAAVCAFENARLNAIPDRPRQGMDIVKNYSKTQLHEGLNMPIGKGFFYAFNRNIR